MIKNSAKLYDLRWRFDFSNSPSKFGKWSASGNSPELQAWRQNKEGMIRASIEGKHVFSAEVKTLIECDGHEFINFQWLALGFLPSNFSGEVTPLQRLCGLKLLTTNNEFEVFASGEIKKSARTTEIQFATFGR